MRPSLVGVSTAGMAAALCSAAGCAQTPTGAGPALRPYPGVAASVETDPVASADDAADDPAIWVDPADPSRSLIIGTNKQEGLLVYGLDGHQVQSLAIGRVNNVDLRANVRAGAREIDLVVATNRSDQSVALFEVDRSTRRLATARADRFATGLDEVYGVAIARDPVTGLAHVFVGSKTGPVQHYRLEADDAGVLMPRLLRVIPFASQVEGMAADDEAGVLFVGEEDVGLWSVPIDHDARRGPQRVHDAGPEGPLVPDVEGITIFDAGGGRGWLIVSSQGDNSFAVFDRRAPHAYRGSFRVEDGAGIDGAQDTDGIDVCAQPLGPAFPAGLLVVQDGFNGSQNQNFKLVPWDRVAGLLPAMVP